MASLIRPQPSASQKEWDAYWAKVYPPQPTSSAVPATVKATYASSPGAYALDAYPSINVFQRDPNRMMNAALGLFRSNPWVAIAERTISWRFARIEWHLEDEEENTIEEGLEGVTPDELAIEELIEKPSKGQTRSQLWRITCRHLGLTGNAFWMLDQTNALGAPLELIYINPVRMTPRFDEARNVLGWVVDGPDNAVTGRQGNPGVPLEPSEVIHFTLDEPDFGPWGIGIAEAAQTKIELDRLATLHEAQVFASGGRLTGIVAPKPQSETVISGDQWQAFVREWRNVTNDPDAAKRLIVAKGPIDFIPTSSNNEQLQLKELSGQGRDDILNAWGVPLSQIGISTTVGLNSGEKNKNDEAILWQNAIQPRIDSFREKVQYELLDRIAVNGPHLELVIESPAFDDQTPLFDSVQKAATVPMTNDERREILGLDPLDETIYGQLGQAVYVMNTMTSLFDPGTPPAPPAPPVITPITPALPAPSMPMDMAMPAKATLGERQLLGLRSRVQPQWERKIRPAVHGHLTEQRQTISDNVRQRYAQVIKKPKDSQAWWNARRWDESLISKLEPLLTDYARAVGTRATRTLRSAKADDWLDKVLGTVRTKAGARIVGINQTTRNRVQDIIEQGVEDGLGPAELGDLIEGDAIFDEARAEMIARTEMMFAYNDAALGSYSEFGVEWVQAIDGDEDEECASRDGQEFTVDEASTIEDHPNGTLDWVPVVKAELTPERYTGPNVEIHIPESVAMSLPAPQVTVNVPEQPAPNVTVHVPEFPAPIVNIPQQPAAQITVNVPEPKPVKATLSDGPMEVVVTKMPQRVHRAVRNQQGQVEGSIEADAQ